MTNQRMLFPDPAMQSEMIRFGQQDIAGPYVFHGSTGETQTTSTSRTSSFDKTTQPFPHIGLRTRYCNLWTGPAEKPICVYPSLSVPLLQKIQSPKLTQMQIRRSQTLDFFDFALHFINIVFHFHDIALDLDYIELYLLRVV